MQWGITQTGVAGWGLQGGPSNAFAWAVKLSLLFLTCSLAVCLLIIILPSVTFQEENWVFQTVIILLLNSG